MGPGTLVSFLTPLCFSFLTCKMEVVMMPPRRSKCTNMCNSTYKGPHMLNTRLASIVLSDIFLQFLLTHLCSSLGPQHTERFLLDPSQGLSLGHPYCPRDSVVLSALELASSGVTLTWLAIGLALGSPQQQPSW